tara:strand:+ start:221 stop:484 length:264 start_codon:yes stop_codon:yes gene_type:complete
MTSTKRLKHISMMLLYEDIQYVEEKLCHSHGDLSHIFRNVFHNFVESLKAQDRANEAKLKKEAKNDSDSTKAKPKKQTKSKSVGAKK